MFARLILDELKSSSLDFDRLCMTSWTSKDSQKVGVNHVTGTRKCIFLLKVKGCSKENAVTAARCVDSSQRNIRNKKGICMVVALMVTVGAIQKVAAPTRCVISVA